MFSQLFRSFLPIHNPIGFGASDFSELALILLLVGLVLARHGLKSYTQALSVKTGWCLLVLALLPIALRLALVPRNPIPTPGVSDDFSYLLISATLAHLRLANPPHPYSQFFETFFVLQQPTYSSVFPIGQGIALALGRLLFGNPWAGVALSIGAFCALSYWMLRAWISPGWALIGGLLTVVEFGPLNQWMNSFWGGAVSACAGCLVFGSLPRLRESSQRRYAVLLGIGLGMQLLTRPYESIFLLLSVVLFFLPELGNRKKWRDMARIAGFTTIAVIPAFALTLLQDKQVTDSWTTIPNALSRYQYGVPAAFTFQPNPIPHRELTPQQELDYKVQSAVHGESTDTIASYLDRLASRVRFYRFFFLAPLYLAL